MRGPRRGRPRRACWTWLRWGCARLPARGEAPGSHALLAAAGRAGPLERLLDLADPAFEARDALQMALGCVEDRGVGPLERGQAGLELLDPCGDRRERPRLAHAFQHLLDEVDVAR